MKCLPSGLLLAGAISALLLPASAAAGDTTPEVYRGIFQWVKPISQDFLITAALGGVESTSFELAPGVEYGNSESIIVVPFGFEYRLNDNLSIQSYIMMTDEINREVIAGGVDLDQPNQLEIRPVIGATLKTDIADGVEIGAWARYEARFKDVTGEGDFESRLRLRPYIDFTFNQDPKAGTAWHTKFEVEPKYVIGSDAGDDYSFVNAVMARASIGYSFSHSLSVDLRYSHEWGRSDAGADWEDSNDMVTIQFVKVLGLEEFMTRKASQIDE